MSAKLQELCRFNVSYARQVGFRLEWSANTLTVVTDRGLELFDLSCNIGSYNKRVELLSSSLACPPRAADMPTWGASSRVLNQLPVITSFAWSPPDIVHNFGSVIAVLASHGSVTLHARRRLGWCMLIDLTSVFVKSKHLEMCDDMKIMETQSSALCWGSMIQRQCCLFLTGQRNGRIIFWTVTYTEDVVKAEVVHELETDIGEIKTITWIPKDNDQFSLVCSGHNGVIKIYNGRKGDGITITENSHFLWPYQDLMVLNHIIWYKSGNNFVIICGKNRHLLVFLVSHNNELLCQYVNNVNDFTIAGLTKLADNSVCIGSSNGAIFKVNITIEREELSVVLNNVSFKEDFSEYALHDIASSVNDAIWTMSLVRKPTPRRFKLNVAIIFLKLEDYNGLEAILKNPSQKLTHMWDCVELLRLECTKEKRLPNMNFDEIFSDPNISTYYMKLYLILSKLHNNYTVFNKNASKSVLNSLSPDTIRDTLLVRHAVALVEALHQLNRDGGRDSGGQVNFQGQVFLGCCRYIKIYCNKYKNDLSSYINGEALAVAKAENTEFTYRCANCRADLVDFKCSCGHPNQFCMVSLNPIEQEDYLVCRVCGGTACVESYLEKPMCIFCDVLLEKRLY